MPALTITFEHSNGDTVTVDGRPGRVDGLTVGHDGGPMYFVRTTDAAGLPSEAWMTIDKLAPPPPATTVPALQYFQLFTQAEQLAIFASDVPQVRQAVAYAQAAVTIDLASQIVTDGLAVLVGEGLVTADRAARIKAGLPPEAAPAT